MLSWVNSLHEELLALKVCLERNLVVEREREVKFSDIVILSRISLVVAALKESSKSLLDGLERRSSRVSMFLCIYCCGVS